MQAGRRGCHGRRLPLFTLLYSLFLISFRSHALSPHSPPSPFIAPLSPPLIRCRFSLSLPIYFLSLLLIYSPLMPLTPLYLYSLTHFSFPLQPPNVFPQFPFHSLNQWVVFIFSSFLFTHSLIFSLSLTYLSSLALPFMRDFHIAVLY